MDNKLEIARMLTIGSGNITPSTWDMLQAHAFEGYGDYPVTVYAKDEFGFFLYLSNEQDDAGLKLTHPDLIAAINLARENSCSVLCIDCDAEPAPGLTNYANLFRENEHERMNPSC